MTVLPLASDSSILVQPIIVIVAAQVTVVQTLQPIPIALAPVPTSIKHLRLHMPTAGVPVVADRCLFRQLPVTQPYIQMHLFSVLTLSVTGAF